MKYFVRLLLLPLLLWNLSAFAGNKADDKDDKKASEEESRGPSYKDPPLKDVTAAERKSACAKYEGKYIANWSDVYKVSNCEFFVLDADEVKRLTQNGTNPIEVSNEVLAALRQGAVALEPTGHIRRCGEFHKKYVTLYFTDVYWVENCVRRIFPNWASYEAHRGPLDAKREAMVITWPEYQLLTLGKEMPSILSEALPKDHVIDVIPIDEACKGLVGQYVPYLGEIYFIQNVPGRVGHCQRRKVDAEAFTRNHDKVLAKAEMTSTQAVSIPEGDPILPPARKEIAPAYED